MICKNNNKKLKNYKKKIQSLNQIREKKFCLKCDNIKIISLNQILKNKQNFLKNKKNQCKNNKRLQILMSSKSINRFLLYTYTVSLNLCLKREKNSNLIKISRDLKKKGKSKKCASLLKKKLKVNKKK